MHVCKGFLDGIKVHQRMRVLTINIITSITTVRTGSRKINIKRQHKHF